MYALFGSGSASCQRGSMHRSKLILALHPPHSTFVFKHTRPQQQMSHAQLTYTHKILVPA